MEKYLLGLFAALCLGCNSSGGAGSNDDGAQAERLQGPRCVSEECGSKQRLVDIPGAENLFFSDDGRLFVTGNENIYEVLKVDGTLRAEARSAGSTGGSGFGGMAQRGDTLYVTMFDDGGLWAARLDEQPEFSLIHPLGLAMPNGMSDGPDGELYVVNGPLEPGLPPDPKVVRLQFSSADAMQVVDQQDWLALPGYQPNGVARRERSLYITASRLLPPSLGVLLRVDVDEGGDPSEVHELLEFTSIPDDLSVAGDVLLLSFFSDGAIAVVSLQGELISRSASQSFDSPSQLRVGRPPLFSSREIVVTEKGLLVPNGLPYGSALSVFSEEVAF